MGKQPFDPPGITKKRDGLDVLEKATRDFKEKMMKTESVQNGPPTVIGDVGMDKMLQTCLDILCKKGNDYTVGKANTDRFYNFRTAAEMFGIPIEKVWGVYFYKHWTAVARFVKEGRVESEPIETRIADMINYLLLLSGMIHEKGS